MARHLQDLFTPPDDDQPAIPPQTSQLHDLFTPPDDVVNTSSVPNNTSSKLQDLFTPPDDDQPAIPPQTSQLYDLFTPPDDVVSTSSVPNNTSSKLQDLFTPPGDDQPAIPPQTSQLYDLFTPPDDVVNTSSVPNNTSSGLQELLIEPADKSPKYQQLDDTSDDDVSGSDVDSTAEVDYDSDNGTSDMARRAYARIMQQRRRVASMNLQRTDSEMVRVATTPRSSHSYLNLNDATRAERNEAVGLLEMGNASDADKRNMRLFNKANEDQWIHRASPSYGAVPYSSLPQSYTRASPVLRPSSSPESGGHGALPYFSLSSRWNTQTVVDIATQAIVDFCAGVMGFILVVVNVLTFASTVCSTPRMEHHTAEVVQLAGFGVVLCGLCAAKSNLRYNVPGPDLFVLPFFAEIVNILEVTVEADKDVFTTFVVISMIMVSCLGGALVGSCKYRLLRLSDYTPCAVAKGLIAGIGVGLTRTGLFFQTPMSEFNQLSDFGWVLVSIAIASCMILIDTFGTPPKYLGAALTMLVASTGVFYLSLFLFSGNHGIDGTINWADSQGLFLNKHSLEEKYYIVWMEGNLFGSIMNGAVQWSAVFACSGAMASYVFLELLRATLQFPSTFKAFGVGKSGDELTEKEQLKEVRFVGFAHVLCGLFGGFGSLPHVGVMMMIQKTFSGEDKPRFNGPLVVATGLMAVLFMQSFSVARYVPKFIIASLLINTGLLVLKDAVVITLQTLDQSEGFVVLAIVSTSIVANSTITAISVGAFFSVLLFVYQWHQVGCIKYVSSGLMWRSSIDRPEAHVEWLEQHGDTIQILQLQGFIFFGNSEMIHNRVKTMLKEDRDIRRDDAKRRAAGLHSEEEAHLEADPLGFVILDFTMVMGLDHTAMLSLEDTVVAASKHNPQVYVIISGASEDIARRIRKSKLKFLNKTLKEQHQDLDSALAFCEDSLIRDNKSVPSVPECCQREGITGFNLWLRLAQDRHSVDTSVLEDLGGYVIPVAWRKGDTLMNEQRGTPIDMARGGLHFITAGLVSKKHDPQQSITTISRTRLLKQNRSSLHTNMREFRFARFGAGWCVGLEDWFTGLRTVGVFEAETDCLVFFLPFKEMKKLQSERPELIMHLLHLLGRLMSSQFNRTKERLSHVLDAMTTINTRKDTDALPSRRTMRLVQSLAMRVHQTD